MPLYFEVDREEILNELGGRWCVHALTLRHNRPGDKLDERVEVVVAILPGYSRDLDCALRSGHAHRAMCGRAS